MFRSNLIFILLISLFTFSMPAQEKKHHANPEKEGYVKALVIKYDVEGCGFIIELEDKDKTKLMAEGVLAEEFKKDKLKIWIKYNILKKQPITTCMAGKTCEVTGIKKRK